MNYVPYTELHAASLDRWSGSGVSYLWSSVVSDSSDQASSDLQQTVFVSKYRSCVSFRYVSFKDVSSYCFSFVWLVNIQWFSSAKRGENVYNVLV